MARNPTLVMIDPMKNPRLIPLLLHLLQVPSGPNPSSPKKRGNSIGARMLALKRFDDGVPYKKITQETDITRSLIYKLCQE
jgi:hypothetical protein